eukprot:477536-Amphidinium_carterae.2
MVHIQGIHDVQTKLSNFQGGSNRCGNHILKQGGFGQGLKLGIGGPMCGRKHTSLTSTRSTVLVGPGAATASSGGGMSKAAKAVALSAATTSSNKGI